MNAAIWVLQCLLSAFFIIPGVGKVSGSKQKHIADGHLKPGASIVPIRVLGVLELLGCVGIIVPWLTGIAVVLTPVAAICFSIVMLAGIAIHLQKKEYKMLPLLVVVLALALIVAYFRFGNSNHS